MKFSNIITNVAELQSTIKSEGGNNLDRMIKQGELITSAKAINKAKPKNIRLNQVAFAKAFKMDKSHIARLVSCFEFRKKKPAYVKQTDNVSLQGLIDFAKGKDDKAKTLMSFCKSKDAEGDGGMSVRILETGEVKANGDTDAILEAIAVLTKALSEMSVEA
mgnify:CR=1 FL=1|tara:strand:- start:84 stop:569 length:486 start_codon:yes stop_codon:yes gene_type:complete